MKNFGLYLIIVALFSILVYYGFELADIKRELEANKIQCKYLESEFQQQKKTIRLLESMAED